MCTYRACKNITFDGSFYTALVAYIRGCICGRCTCGVKLRTLHGARERRRFSAKTLTIYIELPSVLHLRVRNIWHAGATVEQLAGVFDTRHECEDAGRCVVVGTHLPAGFP